MRSLPAKRRQLAACGSTVCGMAFGLGGERERGGQIAVVERDHALQRECTALELAVAVLARGALGAQSHLTRPGGVLPMGGACAVEVVPRGNDGEDHALLKVG